jgi:AraC-like DNA-binding protein
VYEQDKKDLIELILKKIPKNSIFQSKVPSLEFYITERSEHLDYVVYEPSLCIILQGSKEIIFDNEQYEYNQSRYLLVPTHIPTQVQIKEATKEQPYVAFQIKFHINEVYDVLKVINVSESKYLSSQKSLFVDDLSEKLYDSVYRYVRLMNENNETIEFLSPMIKKEILFILLSTNAKNFLYQFAMEGSTSNQIVKVINEIKTNFAQKLNMKELARKYRMSETTLYTHFKTVTSLSPIQFQKQLRLEEARQMIHNLNIEVSQIAFDVGYESASQFSREFKRYFGASPSNSKA